MTGAAGRIGSVLRAGLRDELRQLRCLDVRPVTGLADSEQYVQADLADAAALTAALRGADGVIHLAGIPQEADLHDVTAVNILGTFHLLEAARLAGVPRVVFASSNHVTGMYPAQARVGPQDPVRPDSFYGVSKAAGEAAGRMYADKFGLAVACLRIGTFAPRPAQHRHLSTWASHDDTVAAFRAAMTAPDLRFAVFYVASANRDVYWDMEPGAQIGFHPLDRAETIPGGEAGGPRYEMQGGDYAAPEYTISRQSGPPPGGAQG